MLSPQSILRERVISTIGPTGDNTLSWVKEPEGKGYAYDLACWIGHRPSVAIATHGIAVAIDGMAQYDSQRYSSQERRIVSRCGLVCDLWLPQDINSTEWATDTAAITGQGNVLPDVIESMDEAGILLMNAIKDMPDVQYVRMLPPMQRGVYGGVPTLERIRFDVTFKPELRVESLVA